MRKIALIVIALVVLLSLAGGGAAVYFMVLVPKQQDDATVDPNDPPPVAPKVRVPTGPVTRTSTADAVPGGTDTTTEPIPVLPPT